MQVSLDYSFFRCYLVRAFPWDLSFSLCLFLSSVLRLLFYGATVPLAERC
jgi:hypothetical protein